MAEFVLDEMSQEYLKVDYDPIDISEYSEGNTGVPYVWSIDSGLPGPHAMVCGIMHGNEPAGAVVLDNLLKRNLRPAKGKITFCFGNPEAYARFDHDLPHHNRVIDTDINRVWGAELTTPSRQEYEVRRARELRPIVDTVDYLLDLHSMQGRGKPVALMVGKPASLELVEKITEIPFVLTGTMHQAERLRLRDYRQFGDPNSPAVAIQVEAGRHWGKSSIRDGERIAMQFLEAVGVLAPTERETPERQKRLKVVEIILPKEGVFTYADNFLNGAFFPKKGALIGHKDEEQVEVRTPVDNCYFIMPVHFRAAGGSAGRLAVEI